MSYDQAAIATQLSTIRDYLRWTYSEFNRSELYFGHGTDNPWDEAVQLVLSAAGLPWNADPSLLDATLLPDERARVVNFVSRRVIDREPLPYITGEAWFGGMSFAVDKRVIVPRSPFAELIETRLAPWWPDQETSRVLDLCCGSGCIGILASIAFPEAEIDLVDISRDALEVAQSNILRHGVQERVSAIESDLFWALQGRQYDIILSNPPYVDAQDLASMPAEYHHEPDLALGSGPDGLDITRRILRDASDYLTPDGILVVEVGNSQENLAEVFPEVPFVWIELDQGGHGVFTLDAAVLREHRDRFL